MDRRSPPPRSTRPARRVITDRQAARVRELLRDVDRRLAIVDARLDNVRRIRF